MNEGIVVCVCVCGGGGHVALQKARGSRISDKSTSVGRSVDDID